MDDVTLQVSEAVALINQTLDAAYPFILIEGEVSGFKVNQNKYVFFDIKDEAASLGCFMMVFNLKFPLEDGMRVRLLAQPKLTQWGKFSLTVREVMPLGEGALKKSFELLRAKLEKEGLFDLTRKRPLPKTPARVGVVSSSGAAGYADFIKILDNRWGGLQIVLADVAVQGISAPAQLVGALDFLNELSEPLDVIAIVRGGGSLDDLSSFNHEDVVRAVALSRTPVIAGIGHEVDTSLVDLAADVRAATPSNAAELIVPDKAEVLRRQQQIAGRLHELMIGTVEQVHDNAKAGMQQAGESVDTFLERITDQARHLRQTLRQLDPQTVLQRGYSLVRHNGSLVTRRSDVTIGDAISITVSDGIIGARVSDDKA